MAFDEMKEKITPDNPPTARSRSPSPARGASIPQERAIPPIRLPLRQWQSSQNIDLAAQIKLTRISHMRYQHPDLTEITTFLRDFGMTLARKTETARWFAGYGPDQYVYYAQQGPKKFLGGAFEVESYAELEKATQVPGASPIIDLTKTGAPGGGFMVTLHDPEGFPIHLLHSQTPRTPGPSPEILETNYETHKPRLGKFQRFKPGPAAVHKLGHYGLVVQHFERQVQWYTRTFNFAPTDFLFVNIPGEGKGEGGTKRKDVATFLHIDTGATPTDHHTFFMSGLGPNASSPYSPASTYPHPPDYASTPHVHHCSFEVHDFDSQNLGHEWLAKKGYNLVWGVGRHILGSQIFDYWWDTSGFMVEHYADGDLVTEETPVGWGEAGDESLAVWGPEVPGWFLD